MAVDKKLQKQAEKVAKILRSVLDGYGWHYSVSNDGLSFEFGVKSDAMPMYYTMRVWPDKELVTTYVSQKLIIPESKRIMAALGFCQANNHLVDGSYDFNVATGELLFRVVACYHDMKIGPATIKYLINVANQSFDDVNQTICDYVNDVIDGTEYLKQMSD